GEVEREGVGDLGGWRNGRVEVLEGEGEMVVGEEEELDEVGKEYVVEVRGRVGGGGVGVVGREGVGVGVVGVCRAAWRGGGGGCGVGGGVGVGGVGGEEFVAWDLGWDGEVGGGGIGGADVGDCF
ncbi:hypothetical protein, partial [Kocuria rhizophila]|uniref:hypothetical protein n=1 Tax=Kocuria rhizophila TaxID=72000 RepID=UPI001C92FBEC